MGAVTVTASGPTAGSVKSEGAPLNMRVVPCTITMSSSYATNGDTVSLPADVKGVDIVAIYLANPHNGTYLLVWDGSTSAPKIKAYSAFTTEVTNATNLSAVSTKALIIVK